MPATDPDHVDEPFGLVLLGGLYAVGGILLFFAGLSAIGGERAGWLVPLSWGMAVVSAYVSYGLWSLRAGAWYVAAAVQLASVASGVLGLLITEGAGGTTAGVGGTLFGMLVLAYLWHRAELFGVDVTGRFHLPHA